MVSQANRFSDGVRACVPTILGYLGIGFAMGVVGKSMGLSILQVLVMSVFVYAGSAQFIICGLLAINAPIVSIILTVFMVNLRHFLMSLSVAPVFRDVPFIGAIGIGTLLTDESYGVLTAELQKGIKPSLAWMNGLNVCAYLVWIIATVLGATLGKLIPNPEVFGLDFALIAMFLGLFFFQIEVPLKRRTRQTIVILATLLVSVYLLLWFTTPELAVILSTLIGCLVGVVTHHE